MTTWLTFAFFHISLLCCRDQWLWGFWMLLLLLLLLLPLRGNEIASKCLPLLFSAPPLFVPFDGYVCGWFCVQLRLKYLMSWNSERVSLAWMDGKRQSGKTAEICYTKLWLWRAFSNEECSKDAITLRFNGEWRFSRLFPLIIMTIKWLNHATRVSNCKHVN